STRRAPTHSRFRAVTTARQRRARATLSGEAWGERSGVGGLGVADQGGVDELLEAHDPSAAHDEMVGDADAQVFAGGVVARGVAGEDDDVLAVDDVGVVVRDPVAP